MNGYKIFDNNFCCRGLQYRVGETQKHEGPIEPCKSGLHFCERALDCIDYYPLTQENRYAEVRAVGQVVTKGDKTITDELVIVREIPYAEFRKLCTGVTFKIQNDVRIKIHYKNGVRDGKYLKWDYTGQLIYDFQYVDGKQDGRQLIYHTNGMLSHDYSCLHGLLHGSCTTWDYCGSICATTMYILGKGDQTIKN